MAQAWAILLPVLALASYASHLLLPTYITGPLCTGGDGGGRSSFLCAQPPKEKDQDPSPASTMYKTAFHFQPAKNWMNDPSGPMYFNGIYHEFYQYNLNGPIFGDIVWGHSVSTDLVNWIGLEPALVRDTPSDIDGCWTGSVTILPGGKPVIIYTGGDKDQHQAQNIAFPKNRSDPYLREWVKAANNPVLRPDEPGMNSIEFRDPTTGWIGPDGLWRMAVGGELNGYSAALLYKSEDFLNWTRVDHPLYSSNASIMLECLDFFAVLPGSNNGLDMSSAIPNGAKHVLKMGLNFGEDVYVIGVYDLKRDVFVPDTDDSRLWPRIDYGNFYASKTFFDSKHGRRIIWAWTTETDSSSDDVAKGWAGIHSFPRTIRLDSDGKRLLQWPVEEIESLRGNEINHQGLELKRGDLFEIEGVDTLQADVEIDFELTSVDDAEPFDPSWLLNAQKQCREADASVHGGIGPFGLVILASDNMEEQTVVHFRVYKSQKNYMILMCSDLRRSSLTPGLDTPAYGGFFEFDLEKERKISLRTLIDRSAVESFGGGGRVCIMARVYPVSLVDDDHKAHMYAFNNGSATARVPQLRAWSMRRARVSI
uniref:Fructan 1-exohydrolase n=1 Tax=Secale cereale TaxID=4550 RepID=A0A2U9N6P3_SECCE|nr:putative cell wall invertase d [Secale cereale]